MDATPAKPIEDHHALVQALRDRIVELGITYSTVDEIAGLASRYAAKLLCQPSMKHVSTLLLFPILASLGLRMKLEPDDRAIEKLSKRSDWYLMVRPGPRFRPSYRSRKRK
jgi:hypothetical protein